MNDSISVTNDMFSVTNGYFWLRAASTFRVNLQIFSPE